MSHSLSQRIYTFLLCQLLCATNIVPNPPGIIINSIPKSGTHLLTAIIEKLVPYKSRIHFNWQFSSIYGWGVENWDFYMFSSHSFVPPHPQWLENFTRQGTFIFLYRDPRDIIVSMAYFMREHPWMKDGPSGQFSQQYTLEEYIDLIIDGDLNTRMEQTFPTITTYFCTMEQFIANPQIFALKFEDIAGPKGGGSSERRRTVLENLCAHLDIECNYTELEQWLDDELWSHTATFRTGQIGTWKHEFTQKNKDFFKQKWGSLLVRLNYELDFTW